MRSTAIQPPAVPLTDGVVCLRYRRAADLDAISAASHDPEAQRWLSDPPMDDQARAASLARVAEAFRTGRSAPLVIADHATDQPVGLINVQFRDDQLATIAYSVFPGHRGQGVAPRAVRLATEWAFSQLGLSELRLEIDPGNLASVRVAQKCGFTPAGRGLDPEPGGDGRGGKLVFVIGHNRRMTEQQEAPRVVSASRDIAAGPGTIFELIADPAAQPSWDGNENLAEAAPGQRVRRVGDVFTMTLTRGAVRENHVVEFDEGHRIAWMPAEPGQEPPGHLWRWTLEPAGASRTRVTHTYDWTQLTDETRLPRARATTASKLQASLARLAALAEG